MANAKYKLIAGTHARQENGKIKKYSKGAVLELTVKEATRFKNKFEKVETKKKASS